MVMYCIAKPIQLQHPGILVICLAINYEGSTLFSSKLDKLQHSLCGKIPIFTSLLENTTSYMLGDRVTASSNKVGDWLLGGGQCLQQEDKMPSRGHYVNETYAGEQALVCGGGFSPGWKKDWRKEERKVSEAKA